MFGWVGELAHEFASMGAPGLVLLSLLIIVFLLVNQISKNTTQMAKMHQGMVESLDRSSHSHLSVAKVLSRIEGILGLTPEEP